MFYNHQIEGDLYSVYQKQFKYKSEQQLTIK